MKIRTDFVTNSSSSSFSVIVKVKLVNGNIISFEEFPYEYSSDDGGTVSFDANLSDLLTNKTKKLKSKYSNVESLARFLMNAISDDACWFEEDCDDEEFDDEEFDDEEFCDECEDDMFRRGFSKEIIQRKEEFIKNLMENASNISDISEISVYREYEAWGECADLIADNDQQLCELAQKVTSTSGEEQKAALREMLDYINTPNGDRAGEDFGCNFEDFRYVWDGDDEALLKLATRICSCYGPGDVEGSECQELDLASGTCSKYAEFILK